MARTVSAAHADKALAAKAAAKPSSPPVVIKFAKDPEPTPPFLLNDLTGQAMVSSATFPGKVVILSFWATWCPPCRVEIPELIDLQNRYPDKLQIIGISMDDAQDDADMQKVKNFAAKMGMNYPIVMASHKLAEEYGGVPALPTSFILNTSGKIVQKHVGLFPTETYDNEIRALLGLPVNATVETFEDTGQIFLQNASRATELPGVDFSKLSADQKREALKRMNSEECSCGCGLTVAECRMNDTSCDVSEGIADKIVKDVAAGKPAASPKAAPEPAQQ